MPEGDTIHRAAAALQAALVGRPTLRFEAPRLVGPRPAAGEVVERVDSHGKHIEIAWAGGVVLHTHMRMTGSWHLYRPGERWRAPGSSLRVLVEVPELVAVCFAAPVVETYRASPAGPLGRARAAGTAGLGPDLCRPDADLDLCVERMRALPAPDTPVADVLLDQRLCCGVGNVYKSEVLWACRVHPFTPLADVDDDTRRALVGAAATMLRANLDRVGRVTTTAAPGGVVVYRRAGRPCPRCRTPISAGRQGRHGRVTYWCPTCQPPAGGSTAARP